MAKKEEDYKLLKFKAVAVRTVESPSNPDITTYYTWVNFRELPKFIIRSKP
ncbi:hypothetical protein KXP54_000079 [Staphylococcus pseudintermedius]|nr:hypothetical protein [Staphylococcus pseudintermedius]